MRLASTDPLVDPIVEFRMLSDQRDLVRLREATARVVDVLRHPAVAAIVETVDAAGTPLGSLDSDAAVDTWLTGGVNDYVHAAGTCRMGTPGDPAAVVDLECRVIGYARAAGLRRLGHARRAAGQHPPHDGGHRRSRRRPGSRSLTIVGTTCFAAGARCGRASHELDGRSRRDGACCPPRRSLRGAGGGVVSFVFIWFKQPETKGRSLAEIQEMWERKADRAGKEA